jgi:hypothetical protein
MSRGQRTALLLSLLIPAAGCITGPVDSLTGNWQQRLDPPHYLFTLHQTGTAVTGLVGDMGCVPSRAVTGFVHGTKVKLSLNGDSLAMAGRFLDASTLLLVPSVKQNGQGANVLLDKVARADGFNCNL